MLGFANSFGKRKFLLLASFSNDSQEASHWRGILMGIIMIVLMGCATETFAPENAPEYVIIRNETPFYRVGPQQGQGPDLFLQLQTHVKLLRREMGFSLVQLDDMRTGYVANENMVIAPPRPRSPINTSSIKVRSGMNRSNDEPDDVSVPEIDLPPPDLNLEPGVVSDTIPLPMEKSSASPNYRY